MLLCVKTALRLQYNNLDGILINHGCDAFQILQNEDLGGPMVMAFFKKNPSLLEGKIYVSFRYPKERCHTNREKIMTNIPHMSPRYKGLRQDLVSF